MDNIDEQALRQRFNPDGSLLRRQQMRMLELLLEMDRICKKHNIRYWLIGGTLLGAVRHHGFIPWDDDMDVQMLREDYLRLLEILPKELPDTMALQCRQTDPNYFFQYAKLRDRRSILDENNGYDKIFHERGIYVDIFPIDSHPVWMQKVSIQTIGHSYKILKRKDLTQEAKIKKVLRLVKCNEKVIFPLLRALAHITKGVWLDALGVPFVVPRNIEDLLPTTTLPFEGHDLPVPLHYDKVLHDQYGDYMQMPDINKVNLHVSKLEIYD